MSAGFVIAACRYLAIAVGIAALFVLCQPAKGRDPLVLSPIHQSLKQGAEIRLSWNQELQAVEIAVEKGGSVEKRIVDTTKWEEKTFSLDEILTRELTQFIRKLWGDLV